MNNFIPNQNDNPITTKISHPERVKQMPYKKYTNGNDAERIKTNACAP